MRIWAAALSSRSCPLTSTGKLDPDGPLSGMLSWPEIVSVLVEVLPDLRFGDAAVLVSDTGL